MKLADLTVSDLLEAFARPEPTPGGGSAAAIAGALGVSLLMMVAGLAKTRTASNAERIALDEARATLVSVRDRLVALADADSEAFDQVMGAYRLPKTTDAEKTARKEAIERATILATETPLDTLRAAAEALRHAVVVAAHGNRSAVSDVGVGIELLQAAAAGATANVQINLGSLTDETFKNGASSRLAELGQQLAKDVEAARSELAS
jgi:formiminotetrahydrofolate cyclodeaminase